MFGFNVGVSMTYNRVVNLLNQGAVIYASPATNYVDILPSLDDVEGVEIEQQEVTYDSKTEEVLRLADDYLAQVTEQQAKDVSSKSTQNYDFVSMFGIQSGLQHETKDSIQESQVAQEPQVAQELKDPQVCKALQAVQGESPQDVKTKEDREVPDLSGMTLKGQAQAIAKWIPTKIMTESVLFNAFGKSVIMKLVSEGYLVRTKKGIMLGS